VSLIAVIVLLIVVGVLLWLVNSFLPMDPKIKQLLNVLVIVVLVLWLLIKFVGPLLGRI
jgi:cation transporter-like permease